MSLTAQELQIINTLLMKMDSNDHRTVVGMLNRFASQRQQNAAIAFRIGDKVKWDSKKNGCIQEGTITKINHKTIKVLTASNQQWAVSPTLLSKV